MVDFLSESREIEHDPAESPGRDQSFRSSSMTFGRKKKKGSRKTSSTTSIAFTEDTDSCWQRFVKYQVFGSRQMTKKFTFKGGSKENPLRWKLFLFMGLQIYIFLAYHIPWPMLRFTFVDFGAGA